jgi:hypothetical protein
MDKNKIEPRERPSTSFSARVWLEAMDEVCKVRISLRHMFKIVKCKVFYTNVCDSDDMCVSNWRLLIHKMEITMRRKE